MVKKFQSKGIGENFVLQILAILKKEKKFNIVTVETLNINTSKFYIQKLNFFRIGRKIRLFKNLDIFQKNL